MRLKKALLVFGTRPEAIKMAPLVLELKKYSTIIESKVCVTAQHRGMLDQVLDIFDIKPDFDLDIMNPNQDLYDITEKILKGMKEVLSEYKPDVVFVHGDTTTAFVSALSAFYRKIPIAHVEAGLRSHDLYSPWPEEGNRKLISQLSTYNFAPTFRCKQNLINENSNVDSITITGNTVIDALFFVLKKIKSDEEYRKRLEEVIIEVYKNFLSSNKYILITGHRRENFGKGFVNICHSIRNLAYRYPNIDFVYPVHLNPNVQEPVFELLNEIENIYLIQPMEYEAFVYLMSKSHIILTDSGGIQEEAPSLGKPVIVMRENTERTETLELGIVKLVGTDTEKIMKEVSDLCDNRVYYDEMSRYFSPYGDGTAAEKIIKVILNTL
ncbi:MAG: UDP-N-acetylglucosamine 2-epimerase (non-hydrolyzing) [Sulfurovum sp.]|nr:UDP-N-acetylglucosamine 2-epimerase (non-hydrolyzing) [Sulfurovum sp.]NNJ46161.1 UDP-N-acetylglucosamine 2-epimerase (non-hydrolyzing) [Sulfurovum sp.]